MWKHTSAYQTATNFGNKSNTCWETLGMFVLHLDTLYPRIFQKYTWYTTISINLYNSMYMHIFVLWVHIQIVKETWQFNLGGEGSVGNTLVNIMKTLPSIGGVDHGIIVWGTMGHSQ